MPLGRGGLHGVKANENILLVRNEKKDSKRTEFRNTDVEYLNILGLKVVRKARIRKRVPQAGCARV